MKKFIFTFIFLGVYIFNLSPQIEAGGFQYVNVYVDGKLIESNPKPVIKDGRTLVPLRYISEKLGADVIWEEEDKSIYIYKDNSSVKLKLSSSIIEYQDGLFYGVSDVKPFLIEDRTFVPLRLISNVLGVYIEWDNESNQVIIDSSKSSSIEPFYDISLNITEPTIRGRKTIELLIPDYYNLKNTSQELILLDKETYSGFIVGKSNGVDKKIEYIPNLNDTGEKLLLVNLYDDKKNILASDIKKVTIDLAPKVCLSNPLNKEYKDSISIYPDVNFIAQSIDYIFTNIDTDKVIVFENQDPYSSFTWTPSFEQGGSYNLTIIAHDSNNNYYKSQEFKFNIFIDKKLNLLGLRSGMNISSPVVLTSSRNFNVTETQYILSNPSSNEEIILATQGYGSYTFFPKPELSGPWYIFTRVKDTRGRPLESPRIKVDIDGSPKLQILGIGPNQIVDDDIKVNFRSNVDVDNVRYIFINIDTGEKIILNNDNIFKTPKDHSGAWSVFAEATYLDGKIKSETIKFNVYKKNTYGPVSIVDKNYFLEFASKLATTSFNTTGMSASLQTAQAILETGWGQYVPRDKYSGKNSYNLFGIKGSGPNGYVISNTWEVYNGIRYRVDDKFRAYNNVEEGWNDHKNFLLNSDRYKPVIETMYDGYLSAWSIKTAGYATDPEYPQKLMRIMDLYNLRELDRVFY